MSTLKEGDKAPNLLGLDQNGNKISLENFNGKKVIFYFYPKDNTPGCTAEACSLRDNYGELKKLGFEVVGISADSQKSHQNFIDKHQLPFNLIADTNKDIIKSFGAWGEKKMYGKTYEGIIRSTFIVSENGIIEKIIGKVDTKDHANQILKELSK